MSGALQVPRLEIGADRKALAKRVAELASLPLTPTTDDQNLLARAAVALHHAYGAIESVLSRVA